MRSSIFVSVSLLAAACTAPQQPTAALPTQTRTANERFDALAEAHFEAELALNPLSATYIGDDRYNDRYVAGFSEAQREKERALAERTLAELDKLDRGALDPQREISFRMLQRELRDQLEGYRFPGHLQPLNQFYSFANGFAQLGSGASVHPFKTVDDYDDFLARIPGFVEAVDVAIGNMRRGIERGVVQPRVLMEKVLPQLEAHRVASPTQSIFYKPVANLPESFPAEDRERLTAAYTRAITEQLVPAYRRLHAFVKDEYLPKTRATVALSALPDGEAWYAYLVRNHTTTSLTPEQIHQLGLSEVARIHAEMDRVKAQLGGQGELKAFLRRMAEDPKQKFTSREEMLAAYRDAQARIDASTDKLFDFKPKANYEIRPVEAFRERSAPGGSYQPATPDGSRPGVFYLNTYEPTGRARTAVESLLIHEGSPGHHFQFSVQRELEDLPRFRRFGNYTAYSEGWALYAETLGKELGLYTDPYQYFGALEAELWRSIRLVLDTGLHAKGWTREQAIDYAKANSATTDVRAVAEVERFIAIPGQALSYKIGQLKISELRRKAEAALGPKFDIKAFHRAVLDTGAMPLDVLEEKIDRWIAAQGGSAQPLSNR